MHVPTYVTAVCAAAAATVLATSASAAAKTGPQQDNFLPALGHSIRHLDIDPPGANDWNCRPSAAHPRPVVLVHGTYENRYNNWARMSPELKAQGYCVYALDYGDTDDAGVGLAPTVKGYGDIKKSSLELAAFVDKVLAASGSGQVDLVGHSQGGTLARWYLKADGGANTTDPSKNKVKKVVQLAATNHGTTLSGIETLADELHILGLGEKPFGKAGIQQYEKSDFIKELNADGDTVPGVEYTVIGTKYDEISTPWQNTFMTAGPGATVRNITLQEGCFIDFSAHLSMSYSPRAIGLVKRALDPSAPVAPCVPRAPAW
ncbi:esterase/lipase family protein [Streptomyces sp. AN091965]|uniref:esterase/lipase family protein n=1 Tax=Streptomyces sp. AN091965 TaxID=2927803 RepID=UPI001F612E36|nr:alpha/beta fold hydrolase [Streptomyces sp. AN091965]MCI3928062.1 alpha/beta fold hydrolase [Streptomyces sp. AN091965]